MKQIGMFLILIAMVSPVSAADTYISKEVEFIAPTFPHIDRPGCAKVDIARDETAPLTLSTGAPASFKFVCKVTFKQGCQGTLTLTSTYGSNTNHHEEIIKESYLIKDDDLIKSQ